MYQYPYGNAQQLNLDWILSKLQELESGSGGGADLEEVANALVSASFDATIPYRKYDYAFYDGKLYRALNDTIGAFNPADWMEVTLGADIPVLTRLVNADSALITTLQNLLQNLGSDEVANESTVTGTTVSDALGNLSGAITSLGSDDIANDSTNVSGLKVTNALDTLNGAINDVENAVAIVSDGNTHPELTNGNFVYVKNHGTLAEGLYQVNTNLAQNATLTPSNAIAQPNGIANELIKTRTVSGTTGTAGQFSIGSSGAVTVIAVKCDPYIGFARLDNNAWWGFLKNWDLSSPGAVSYSATIYYIIK